VITPAELAASARSYLRAAKILNRATSRNPDASAYLCGYAVEIALKARICQTLSWGGYPETNAEFRYFLHLSGREDRIKKNPDLLTDWSVARPWNPEQRYSRVGSRTDVHAREMIEATSRLLGVLL
jgi:hypothetical protein